MTVRRIDHRTLISDITDIKLFVFFLILYDARIDQQMQRK